MEYRTNFLINTILFVVVSAVVQMYLWHAVYSAGDTAMIAGMNSGAMLLYIACSVMCYALTRGGRIERDTAETIRTGRLNNFLLKPLSYLLYAYTTAIAERISSVAFVLIPSVLIVLPLSSSLGLALSVPGSIAALAILFLAATMNFLMGLMISYLAFWLDEVWTFHAMKDISYALLSGMMVPLSALPDNLRMVSDLLPFRYLAYVPAGLITGSIDAAQFPQLFLGALIWTVLLIAMTVALWKLGLQRYGAFGG